MRAARPSDLLAPALGGALLAVIAALVVARASSLEGGVAVGLLVWLLVMGVAARKPLRRLAVARRPLPEASRRWIEAHIRLYAGLDAAGRERFERDVAFVLDGLQFEGAGGAVATDELKLSVAAGAALLLHGRPDWELPTERTVLFVPDTFDEAYGDEEPGLYDGMVHHQGPIVLSTKAVEDGWSYEDGYNVVLHELAHVFDFEGWEADGVPSFLDPRSADAWVALMRKEMRRAERGDGILRAYAASAPAELFAVATEQFFERPARLRNHHPELFEALVAFYNLTPPDEPEVEHDRSLMSRRWSR